MAFNLTPEERQKVCDTWKPSYTDAQYKAFCYLFETAEDKSVRTELGPLERYSPENLYEYISEARFLTAVQCVVSDFAQDSHHGRKEGPEFTTPNFRENIRELGYPSQFFWTDLQVIISHLQRTAWHTVARIYDINDKPTPKEEEKFKAARESLKNTVEIDAIIQQSKERQEATKAVIQKAKEQLEAAAELILKYDVTDPVLYKKPSLWKRLFCR